MKFTQKQEENMIKIIGFFDRLSNTDSRIEKENILETINNEDEISEEIKNILYFLYNPYIVTNLSDKKMNKSVELKEDVGIDSIGQYLDFLSKSSGKDSDIVEAKTFIQQQNEEFREFLYNLAIKDLKCGITSKTINKVMKGFIPEFELMLAEKWEGEIEEDKIYYATKKFDGLRCVIIKQNDKVNIFTRSGQLIEGLVEIEEECKYLMNDRVYDGELLAENPEGLNSKELYKKTMKIARKKGIKTGLEFHMFDFLPIEEFQAGKSEENYMVRRILLENLFESFLQDKVKRIKKVEVLYTGNDVKIIEDLIDKAVSNGDEGIMLNDAEGLYLCKRNKGILKCKKFLEADIRCIGIEEGKGRNKGKLGKIIVEYEVEGYGKFECGCGSGFTQKEREMYFNNPELIVGKIIAVKYFEVTENSKTESKGLRFPIFKDIRNDKNEVDILKFVKSEEKDN